jgi:hypothetical protein
MPTDRTAGAKLGTAILPLRARNKQRIVFMDGDIPVGFGQETRHGRHGYPARAECTMPCRISTRRALALILVSPSQADSLS